MVQVTFYKTYKRANSTKRPTGGVTFDAEFKEDTDIYAPTFIINERGEEVKGSNIVKAFDIYYSVESVQRLNGGLWKFVCSIDLLATYKPQILATSAYIDYASNTSADPFITDPRISSTEKIVRTVSSVSMPFFDEKGTCIIDVVNSTNIDSFTSKYIVHDVDDIVRWLLGSRGFFDDLIKWYENPLESIIDSYWFPFNCAQMLGENTFPTNIIVGKVDTGIVGSKVIGLYENNSNYHVENLVIKLPTQYGDYRDAQPYTTYDMYIPFVGFIPINASDIVGNTDIYLKYGIDLSTGAIVGSISTATNGSIIQTFSGNCKSQIPIAQIQSRTNDLLMAGLGSSGVVAGVVTGQPLVAIGGATAVVSQAINRREQSNNGSIGSRATLALGGKITLVKTVKSSTVERNAYRDVIGVPIKAVHTIGSYTGYVQTAGASVSAEAPKSHIQALNTMLDTGVYIE